MLTEAYESENPFHGTNTLNRIFGSFIQIILSAHCSIYCLQTHTICKWYLYFRQQDENPIVISRCSFPTIPHFWAIRNNPLLFILRLQVSDSFSNQVCFCVFGKQLRFVLILGFDFMPEFTEYYVSFAQLP